MYSLWRHRILKDIGVRLLVFTRWIKHEQLILIIILFTRSTTTSLTTCLTACQTTCLTACLTACQTTCLTTCQTTCQTACQTASCIATWRYESSKSYVRCNRACVFPCVALHGFVASVNLLGGSTLRNVAGYHVWCKHALWFILALRRNHNQLTSHLA